MNSGTFDNIFARIKKYLDCERQSRPDIIPPKLKLAVTLEYVSMTQLTPKSIFQYIKTKSIQRRYLASGSLQRHLASTYRISEAAFGKIIDDVCDAISTEFKDQFETHSIDSWIKCANQYNAKWNFPNCVGAIDGKHIAIKCPKNAGSLFFNYKVNCL